MATRKTKSLKPYWNAVKILKQSITIHSSFEDLCSLNNNLDNIKYQLIEFTRNKKYPYPKMLNGLIAYIGKIQSGIYLLKAKKDPRKKLMAVIEGNKSFEDKLSYIFMAKELHLLNYFFEEMNLLACLETLFAELAGRVNTCYYEALKDMKKLLQYEELVSN